MLLRCESELKLLVVFRQIRDIRHMEVSCAVAAVGDMLVQDPPVAQYEAIFQLPFVCTRWDLAASTREPHTAHFSKLRERFR
jgi:hypothetical protein